MHRNAVLSLLLLAGCSSSAEPSPNAPPPGTQPGTEDAPAPSAPAACPEGEAFRLVSAKVVVQVSINGGAPKPWVLDTGAPTSVADASIADDVKGKDVTLSVGGVTRHIGRIAVMDMSEALRMDVAGIIGHDVFGEVLTLDYPRKRFWIAEGLDDAGMRACTHVRGEPTTVDAVYEDYVYVRGSAEGKPGWFLVDSGASFGAMPNGVFAELQAAHPRAAVEGFYTPAAIGTFWAKLTTIARLEVGGARVEDITTRTLDDGMLPAPKALGDGPLLGVLPSGFLRHFMVTVDFTKQKVRLDAERDAELREPHAAFPVGIGLETKTDAPVHVAQVLAGSAAEEAGIVVGDEVVAIDGKPLASMDPYERPWRLVGPEAGTTVKVTIAHDGAQTTHSLVTRDLLMPPKLP